MLETDGKARWSAGLEAADMCSWTASAVKGRYAVLGRSWKTVSVEHRFLAATWLPSEVDEIRSELPMRWSAGSGWLSVTGCLVVALSRIPSGIVGPRSGLTRV